MNIQVFRGLAFCVGAAAIGTSAQAQSSDPTSTTGYEEIVVTAQKRAQSLADVPLSIQAFSGAGIERQGIKSVVNIMSQVPSASYGAADASLNILQMRGISQNARADASVAFYIDEIPMGFPGYPYAPTVDALDIDRVEVLRGPQGTLYGLGAMGGTVRTITRDPSFSEGLSGRGMLEAAVTQGGDPSYLASAVLNVPLVEDKLALRVAGSHRRQGGWIEAPEFGLHNVNDETAVNVRAKLLFTPTDRLTIKLTYARNSGDSDWSNRSSKKNRNIITDVAGTAFVTPYADTDLTLASGLVTYDLGFAKIENSLSYFKYGLTGVVASPLYSPLGTLRSRFDDIERDHGFTDEIRIVSNGDTAFQWVAGFFYRDAHRSETFGGFLELPSPLPTIPVETALTKIHSRQYSFFGEASYGISDDLIRILVGGRTFHDKRHSQVSVEDVVTDEASPTFTSFNPRFNVMIRPTRGRRDLAIYFNAAKGYRSGLTNTPAQMQAAAGDGVSGIRIVDPDSIWTYETGTKFGIFDRKVHINLAAYISKWKDMQLFNTSQTNIVYGLNGGDATIKGLEAELNWNVPVSGLTVAVSGSYTHAVFDTVNPVLTTNPVYYPGARLPNVPRWSGSVTADYVTPLNADGLNLVAGGAFLFKAAQSAGGADPGIVTDRRSELSLRLGIKHVKWEITAFVNNVTNDRTSITEFSTGQWSSPVPRTMGLRVVAGF